jgi:hypothetical protein
MAGYTPQDMRNLLLKFYPGDYSPQSMGGVILSFNPIVAQSSIANIRASISSVPSPEIYQDTTYTYLKYCERYIIGYHASGVHILTRKCVYGGIRDLGAELVVFEKIWEHGLDNLPAQLYGWAVIDLPSLLHGWDTKNLEAYLRGWAITDLPGFLHGWDTKNLGAHLSGWAVKDLSAYLYSIEPADLKAILNVIEIRDLPGTITGEWWKGTTDLGGDIWKISFRGYKNLQGILSGWAEFDLQGIINIVFSRDLPSSIFPLRSIDLPAYIFGGGIAALYAFIHGFDTRDLGGYLMGGFGPGDLQASIYAIPHQNITAYIRGFKGVRVPFDLRAFTVGSYIYDLNAYISAVRAIDLGAYLNARGQSANLGASIIPKTILIRKAILVALLEHKDLIAMINYKCQLSKAVDLSAYVYPLMKLDLRAEIIGWFGGTSDNIKDLRAYINVANYFVQDKLELVGFVPEKSEDKYASLILRFGVRDKYSVFDDIDIIFGTRYNANLNAYINGVLTSVNLPATLTPVWDWNYTELPSWVIPKTHEVVINIERFEEQWRRFVEIMFDNSNSSDYHYFYVSGTSKVYRLNRDAHWTIWVKSYVQDDESIIDRKNVRFKYGFNMSNYSTIDDAVRDLIDRVSAYRKSDLPASLNVIPLTKYKDLNAYLSPKVKYTWSNNLKASITVV